MKQIKIISTTKAQFKETYYKDNELLEIQKTLNTSMPFVSFEVVYNNTEALSKVYNRYINNDNKDYILVFVHDDLCIEDVLLHKKLNKAMESYDVVGLAGIKAPITIKEPCLWHLMGDRKNMSGAVAHYEKEPSIKRFMTSFGPMPERVVLLDGVFLAINTEKILEKGLKFDENNPAKFHFYDLHFSLDANNLGLKLGTWPIWCTHKSPGLENVTQEWLEGQKYFINKWG